MKKTNIFITLLILAVLAVVVFFVLKGTDEQGTPAETVLPAALTVSETTVTEAQWPEVIRPQDQ